MNKIDTNILIERALQGEITASESQELRLELNKTPEAKEYLEVAQESLNLLLGIESDGLKAIDWRRLEQSTAAPKLGRWSGCLGNVAIAIFAAFSIPDASGFLQTTLISVSVLIFLARARASHQEIQDLIARTEQVFLSETEFLPTYSTIVKDELKYWVSEVRASIAATIFLVFLALIGNREAICLSLAAAFFVLAFLHRRFIVQPLKREFEGLKE